MQGMFFLNLYRSIVHIFFSSSLLETHKWDLRFNCRLSLLAPRNATAVELKIMLGPQQLIGIAYNNFKRPLHKNLVNLFLVAQC